MRDEFADLLLFEDISRRAIPQSLEHRGHIHRRREDHDARAGYALTHLPGHLQAAKTGHPHIDNEHVRAEAFDQDNRVQSITGLADHTQVLLTAEHGLEALTDERVSLCEEDGDRQRESFLLDVLYH